MTLREYEDLLEGGPRLLGVPAIPLVALVVANLIPLAAVLVFGWDLRGVMLVYWAENVLVGVVAVIRMIWIGGASGLATSIFFCVHYGMFVFVHLVFVYALTEATDWNRVEWEGSGFSAPSKPGASFLPDGSFFAHIAWWALAALAVSHGISFVQNFLRGGEWRNSSVQKEMARPYPRMAVMHIAIIAGAFFIALAGQPVALLAVLVLLKIAVDATAHVIEHRLSRNRSRDLATLLKEQSAATATRGRTQSPQ